jgi:hypothetical protein
MQLDYKVIIDFCKCGGYLLGKGLHVGLVLEGSDIRLFAYNYTSCVEYKGVVDGSGSLNIGVSFDRFLQVSKKLYDAPVEFSVDRNWLFLKQGNMKAKLPITEPLNKPSEKTGFRSVLSDRLSWMVDSLSECNASVADFEAMRGVLVDHTPEFVKLCKMSPGSVTIRAGTPCFDSCTIRYVVPPEAIKVVSSFKQFVKSVGFSSNLFCTALESGVKAYTCLLADSLPISYISDLGLNDGIQLITNPAYRKYPFNRDALFSAIDSPVVIADSKRSFVKMESIGFDSSGLMVWEILCKSADKTLMKDSVTCSETFNHSTGTKFNVSGKDFISALHTYGENIDIYDADNLPIVISNKESSGVTLLIKAND